MTVQGLELLKQRDYSICLAKAKALICTFVINKKLVFSCHWYGSLNVVSSLFSD